jgi:polar amino acid transport system substrate-binding protein
MLLALAGAAPARAETIIVYTNASFAPLMIDGGHGLYPDMVDYLNRQNIPGLNFRLEHMPRKRLQVTLEEQKLDGIVIGMMPQWFGDEAQKKYHWTLPFIFDSFVLVSTAAKPFNYDLPAAQDGARIGVTLGYVYPGIDEWIALHKLQRNDAPTEEKNLEKLVLGRVDAVIVAESVLRYFIKTHPLAEKLKVSALPGQQTERRFLVPHPYHEVYERLAPVIRKLKDDPVWQSIRARYE